LLIEDYSVEEGKEKMKSESLEERVSGEMKHEEFKMYIGGEWTDSSSEAKKKDVINPATENAIASVPQGTREDVKRALEAADEAQGKWEDLSPLQRGKYLLKMADLVRESKERLARILTAEEGKPLYESRLEIEGSATNFAYYAEFARRIEGDILPSDYPKQSVMILKMPIGVVASITPWNFPSSTVARKIAPALITGNTVVTKPSSNTPLSTIELAKIAEKAELPKGVLNVVTGEGSEVGSELASNSITGLITLTGSTDSGRKTMEAASGHVAKVLLELGGKAPLIVWRDADLGWALKCAIWARFWNCGQTCISAERMYLDEKIKGKFLSAFAKAAKELRIGDPTQASVDLGPMVSKKERETTIKFVEKARDEGDKIILGGTIPKDMEKGYYFEPTIIDGVAQKSPLVQQEIFGPVVPVVEVDDFDQAIEFCNDSQYGLSSYIYTRDSNLVMKAMYKIKFGESYINMVGPEQFQGAHTGYRQTGIGAEGSKYGLECYTQLKTCYIDWANEPNIPYLFPYAGKSG
jgi:acyl-CoA reductase-like NAD-dependent aldehyde dehydrogenase